MVKYTEGGATEKHDAVTVVLPTRPDMDTAIPELAAAMRDGSPAHIVLITSSEHWHYAGPVRSIPSQHEWVNSDKSKKIIIGPKGHFLGIINCLPEL